LPGLRRMGVMNTELKKPARLRESKRKQTLELITEAGIKLFVENGYEATTLDAIAAAAGISRRTFFYYFKSKEDVLLARQATSVEALRATMRESSPDQAPLVAARQCILKLAASYETKEAIAINRLMLSTESFRARIANDFVEKERILLDAMSDLWPAPKMRETLRIVAMMAMGTLRLAVEDWKRDEAKHPLAHYISRSFALLDKYGREFSLPSAKK